MKASDRHPVILLLAGTGDARRLADMISRDLPEVTLISSLAGVTRSPAPIAGRLRQGGFGGIDGLAAYLRENSVSMVVDATHPFAASMTGHAVEACRRINIPYLRFDRPAWTEQPGDRWHRYSSLDKAAAQVAGLGTRILLTVGSKDLQAFKHIAGPTLYARMTEPPAAGTAPHNCTIILERGPFDLKHERALLSRLNIDLLVTKNSGGNAVAAKLEAARALGVPVLMVDRPAVAAGAAASDLAAVRDWIAKKIEGC